MSRQITQPVNQVRLTNVAVVRLSRHGHRFEVACYRNKIVNYRQGTETDLSEVLQTSRVFTNVSKGQFAKSSLLQQCFGTSDEEEACRFILDSGDVQISDRERTVQLESTMREVATMVSEKCVHPVSRRPYTMAQVRDAMKMAGFMVHPTRNVKQQFLDCVRLLQKTNVLNIVRAKMKLALVLLPLQIEQTSMNDESSSSDNYAERRTIATDLLIDAGVASTSVVPPVDDCDARIVFQSDPSLYRAVEGIARDPSVQGRLEIIQQCVTEEGDVALGSELERRAQQQQLQEEQQSRIDQNPFEGTFREETENLLKNGASPLSCQLQSRLTITDRQDNQETPSKQDHEQSTHGTATEAAVPYDTLKPINSRKAQKAAQKKSKKAKRREKEEQAERQERISAERARQRERAERLGLPLPGETGANLGGNQAGGKTEGDSGSRGDTKPCNTCGGAFTPAEYRSHFRSDWHRYNVKLKMRGVAPVSEKEFLVCDSDAFFE